MRTRILLVGRHADAAAPCELPHGHELVETPSAAEALALVRRDGPFAVVACARSLADAQGLDLLRTVRELAPESSAILIADEAGVEQALGAQRAGEVFRLLREPFAPEDLAAAIVEGVARHAEAERLALQCEELRFAKEALAGFAEMLEARITTQTAALRRLHAFAVDLNAARSMQAIVDLAAAAVHETLGRRGVHVQVWDDEAQGAGIESSLGPEMSDTMHREPLSTKDGPIGEIVVDLGRARGAHLSDAEIDVLASIASATAVAAHHELRRRERDQSQHATILALARLSEARDNQTGKHLERVAAYCELIARGLREDGCHADAIDDVFVEDIVRSSPLHDIGKVGIPDSILLKPGKLSFEEWEIMKTHAELGALTLDSVIAEYGSQGFLAMGRDIARAHHERWDGSGYPAGTRGAAIPLAARILAVADVYDALTTVRPYKTAWSHLQAVEWLCSRSGSHFDPEIVASFLKRHEQADAIRTRLADRLEDQLVAAGVDLANRSL